MAEVSRRLICNARPTIPYTAEQFASFVIDSYLIQDEVIKDGQRNHLGFTLGFF